MTLVLKSGPELEPISQAVAKSHLRVSHDEDDNLISGLITSARLTVEAVTRSALITQSWSFILDEWGEGRTLQLPLAPVVSLDAIGLWNDAGEKTDVGTTFCHLGKGAPAKIALNRGQRWPTSLRETDGIYIDFTAGYGDDIDDVPAPLRQAILQLIAHWYENRGEASLSDLTMPVPASVGELVGPYRQMHL
ncbi:MAG: head-tail connector protein [Parvibaculaceae bacterium]|nr:head-tail connector protein [Parvibaculaceae bacterium]